MERWDLDCQKCGENIINYYFAMQKEIFVCPQHEKADRLLEKGFPRFEFNEKGEITGGNIPLAARKKLIKYTKEVCREHSRDVKKRAVSEDCIYSHMLRTKTKEGMLYFDFDFLPGRKYATWHKETTNGPAEGYYERAGIKRHEIKGSGRGRWGYAFDPKCAAALQYRCDVCGSKLEKKELVSRK